MKRISLFMIMLLLLSSLAQAATYYVATTGNDNNPGTQASPFRTITKGVARAANSGDTVQVAAGTYVEQVSWANKSIYLKGAGAAQCIIDADFRGWCISLSNVPSTARVEGFTLRNGDGFPGGGMFNSASSPTVTRCIFTHNRSLRGAGMCNIVGSNPMVNECIFAFNDADPSGGGMYNRVNASPTLKNCLFYRNTALFGGAAMHNQENSNPTLIHCTFANNSAPGGASGSINNEEQSHPVLNNCILWGNTPTEISNVNSTTTMSFSNVAGGYAGTGNINADPLFENVQGDNYHLLSGSPCIDAGSAAVPNLPATDLDGLQRILGSKPDMGAYEVFPANYSWYVDKLTGNDANPGTQAQPFATVTRALTMAVNGNSIYIKQGNYGTDRPRVTKSLRLFSWLDAGLSRIGQP